MDQKRWNARTEDEWMVEGSIHLEAPHTKEQTLYSNPDIYEISDEWRINLYKRPRLSDALVPHDSEKPAIRDLAPCHDLSRIHHRVESELGLSELRSHLIEG